MGGDKKSDLAGLHGFNYRYRGQFLVLGQGGGAHQLQAGMKNYFRAQVGENVTACCMSGDLRSHIGAIE